MRRDSKLTGILGIVCVKIAQVCALVEVIYNYIYNDNINKVAIVIFGVLFVALFDIVEATWIKDMCNNKHKNNHEQE